MATPVVLARGTIAGCGAYHCPHVAIRARAVATNTVPTSAFRGFGAPQIFFAIELHMTRAAEKAGFDPFTFRKMNLLKEGDLTATGQLLRYSVGLGACLDAVYEKSDFLNQYKKYRNQPANLRKRRGIGIAACFHGAGFTGKGEDRIKAKAGVKILPDGSVKVLCGTTEMGQGMRTVLPQIVAETLQLPMEKVAVEVTDTTLVPNSGPTVASRTTMIVGKVLYEVSMNVIEALKKSLVESLNVSANLVDPEVISLINKKTDESFEAAMKLIASSIEYRDGGFYYKGRFITDFAGVVSQNQEPLEFYSQYSHPPFIQWDEKKFEGDAYAGYGWAALVAEVEVDMETFEVEVTNMYTAQDMGKAINPVLVEGQIEGGTLQAFGYSLLEELKYNRGKIMNNNLTTYIIPTALDAPPLDTTIIESEYPFGPYGAKGIGEMPHVVPAGAIAAAVRQAAGVDIDEIPITPERLFDLIVRG